MSFQFTRKQRLEQSRDFRRLRSQGQSIAQGCLLANWSIAAERPTSRLGVVTSKKIGNAVERNRARRLLREAFRLHQQAIAKPIDLVLVARPSIAGKSRSEVERDFLSALRKAGLKAASPPAKIQPETTA